MQRITSLKVINNFLYLINWIALFEYPNNISASGRSGVLKVKDEMCTGIGENTENLLSVITPKVIDFTDFLKDVVTDAIYGRRCFKGMIFIFTKRGGSVQSNIKYDGTYGFRT